MVDDVNANIGVNIDTSSALASLKVLQRQISLFHTQMAAGGATANAQAAKLQSSLLNAVSATGQFQASMTRVNSTTEAFTTALEKNKLTMGQYFRYAGGASKTFGRAFKSEFDTISKVAVERVKDLQTQYISMGRDANGALRAIKIRPLALDMQDLTTKTMIAAQKQQLFNQLLTQGSTNLLNFGKNTQWAGRQLMVGFTIPLTMFATAAAKSFMDIEKQIIKIRRVYGDFSTTVEETDQMVESIKSLAGEYTKYGIAVKDTIGLASEAAAAGKTGQELLAQVSEATRLAVLGNVEQSQALETTMSITNAFGTATDQLASKIDFLNAVENQSVTSIEDLTEAIPKAGPVVQQLGGDVEDLAFFLTAMKEGGINASEGANALKSGLAALINPTGKAKEMLQGFGINIEKIVESNKGDIKGLVIDFASALDTLDPLNRARAIEQLFGKFQFSRLSTLFQNVIGEGTQASRVLELTKATTQELAILSQRELKKVEDTTTYKFEKAFADFQAALAPVGESFLKVVTPILEFGTKLLEQFNSMGDGAKNFTIILTTVVAGIGPVLLMTVGLVANGVANLIKMFQLLGGIFRKTGVDTGLLGTQTDYMTQQQIEAAAVAASLNQSHSKLTQTFSVEAAALNALTAAYQRSITAQRGFSGAGSVPKSSTRPKKYASGIVSVPGPKGKGDVVPAMLSPGEAVIPAAMAKKYGGLINGMIAGDIPGHLVGKKAPGRKDLGLEAAHFADPLAPGSYSQSIPAGATALGNFTMDVPREINQLMKAGGVDPDEFETILAGIKKKIFATAEGAVKKVGIAWDKSTQEIAQEIEDEIVSETAKIAREAGSNVKDVHGSQARETVLKKRMAAGGKAGKIAKALEAEATTYGGYRTDNVAAASGQKQDEYFRRQYQSGQIIRKGKTFFDPSATDAKGNPLRVGRFNWGASGSQSRIAREEAFAAWEASGGKPENMPETLKMRSNSSQKIKDSFESRPTQAEIVDPKAVAKAKEIGKKTTKAQQDALNEGAATQAQTKSPSRVTRRIGEDTAQGYINGVQSGVTKAEKTGRTSGRRVTMATGVPIVVEQSGSQMLPESTRRSRRAQRFFATTNGGRDVSFTSAAARDAYVTKQEAVRAQAIQRVQNANTIGSRVKGMGGKIASGVRGGMGRMGGIGGMMAAGAIGGGLSMIPGMEALGAAVGIVGPLMMMLPGPIAAVAAGLGAMTAIVMLANAQKEAETKRAIELGNAMSASTAQINSMAEELGTVSISEQLASEREMVIGTSQEALTAGQSFLRETDAGKNIVSEATKAVDAGATDDELSTAIRNKFAYAVAQGIMDATTAQDYAAALAVEIGKKDIGVKVKAEIEKLVGPNGENLLNNQSMVLSELMTSGLSSAQSTFDTAAAKTTTKSGGKGGQFTSKDTAGMKQGIQETINAYSVAVGAADIVAATFDQKIQQHSDNLKNLKSGTAEYTAELNLLRQAQADRTTQLDETRVAQVEVLDTLKEQREILSDDAAFNQILNISVSDSYGEEAKPVLDKIDALEDKELGIAIKMGLTAGSMNIATANALLESGVNGDTLRSQYNIYVNTIGADAAMRRVFAINNAMNSLRAGVPLSVNQLENLGRYSGPTGASASTGGNTGNAFDGNNDSSSSGGGGGGTPEDAELARLNKLKDKEQKALNVINLKEEAINKVYEKRKKALEDIAKLNQKIAENQKSQLTIAEALSSGDISAAARAVQDARAKASQYAEDQQMQALEKKRQLELDGIIVNGKTKEAYEAEIARLNLKIAERELAIANGASTSGGGSGGGSGGSSGSSSGSSNTSGNNGSSTTTTTTTSTGNSGWRYNSGANPDSYANAGQGKYWKFVSGKWTETVRPKPDGLKPGYFWAWDDKNDKWIQVADPRRPAGTSSGNSSTGSGGGGRGPVMVASGGLIGYSMGGKVATRYLAPGGMALGSDTVPAMLTPGEFVIKRPAVQGFGVKNLQAINSGQSLTGSVYNYSVTVNAATGANADDIARTVISKIKQVEGQKLRGNRY